MRFVPALGVGEAEQDRALFAGLTIGELAVHRGLNTLVGKVLTPATHLGRARGSHQLCGPEYPRPQEPCHEAPGSIQISPCPELRASGGAVMGSTATAVPSPSGRGKIGVVN